MALQALIPMLAGMGMDAAGNETANQLTVEGAELQAAQNRLAGEERQRNFERDIELQQPFLDVGTEAVPMFSDAISNKLDASSLPAFMAQMDTINAGLGDGAPQFVKDRLAGEVGAMENERQKGRLQDLMLVGQNAAGAAGTSGVNTGSALSRILANTGAINAEALQNSATNRQNMVTGAFNTGAGLPAYFASTRRPQQGAS